jgi:hypothetical protein
MVFSPAELKVEIAVVVLYILDLLFSPLLIVLVMLAIPLYLGLVTILSFRQMMLSVHAKRLRHRRDMRGYALMLVGPLAGLISYYLTILIIITGAALLLTRIRHELQLHAKIKQFESSDTELYEVWLNDLYGKDADLGGQD